MVFSRIAWLGSLISGLVLNSPAAHADFITYLPNGDESRLIDFGAGEDGAFSDGPTQSGITVVGAAITFNTDIKSEFHFTDFTLTAAATATVTGTRPLTIKTTGGITIAGILRANGGNGSTAPATAGGVNRGGGAVGGTGGILGGGANATAGTFSHTGSAGGGIQINPVGSGNEPAGGGGCFGVSGAGANDAATAGTTGGPGGAAGVCATSRSTIANAFESEFLGGGSGGGGASYGDPSSDASGGGGGAGGGAIRLSARDDVTVSGTLEAKGGAGGDGDTTVGPDCGAGGGSGSGGAIWIQAGGNFSTSVASTVSVSPGAAGTSPCVYTGGVGSRGVIRVDAGATSFLGSFTPVKSPDLSFSMTAAPVVTAFKLKGAGLACGMIQDESRNPNDPDTRLAILGDLLVLGVAAFFALRLSKLTEHPSAS